MQSKPKNNIDHNNEYFETWSPEAFANCANYQNTLRKFSSSFIRGDVLDIGCGSRVYYNFKNIDKWTGVDLSKKMINEIQFFDNIDDSKLTLDQGDATNLEYKDNSFDTVCAFFIIHHLAKESKDISEKRVISTLKHAKRVLRQDGCMVVAENASGPLEWPYHLMYSLFYKAAKKLFNIEMPYFWRKKQFYNLAKNAGFSKVNCVHLTVDEWIYNPVLKIKVPPILSSSLFQTMTLYILEK